MEREHHTPHFEHSVRHHLSTPTFSQQALALWAKSGDETGNLNLPQHLMDSAGVAGAVFDFWVAEPLKRRLQKDLNLTGPQLRNLYIWLAGTHDVGKACIKFQTQLEQKGGFEHLTFNLSDAGLPLKASGMERRLKKLPHGICSGVLISDWLRDQGFTPSTARWLASAADAHHGVPSTDGEQDHVETILSIYSTEWQDVHRELLDTMADITDVRATLGALRIDAQPDPAAIQLLTGLVVIADWIASNPDAFPMVVSKSQEERVRAGMLATDLTPPWSGKAVESDVDEQYRNSFGWSEQYHARSVQTAMIEAAKAVTEPSLIILEAETGVGKTEAALASAHIIANATGAQGIYFAAPTMATANGLLDRTITWAKNVTDSESVSSLYLAHSKNQLSQPYQRLRFKGIGEDDSAGENVIASSWMSGRRRGLLSNVVVGTVDQVLMMALRQRYSMLRHVALAGKIIIFDEVHAYDAYTSDYLETALEWLARYGATVIMMSATLPPERRNALVKAFTGRDIDTPSEAYPLITVASKSNQLCFTPEPSPTNLEATIDIIKDSLDTLQQRIGTLLDDGGVALIICNTIARAQETYRAFKQSHPDEVELHHAGFMAWERSEKEDRLRNELGPKAHRSKGRPHRKIVVATQVAEQSLDIDADVLVTDIAPMDLLIQRIGRLHRHERPDTDRPEQVRQPKVLVRGIEALTPHPVFNSGAVAIYGLKILLTTVLHLPKIFKRPDDVAELVRLVYADSQTTPAEWGEEWEKALIDDKARTERAHGRSESFRIKSPNECRTLSDLYGDLKQAVTRLGSDEVGAAQVRDTEPTVEVIPIVGYVQEYTSLGADWTLTGDPELTYPQAFHLASSTVRLPTRMTRYNSDFEDVVGTLEQSTPIAWNKHYLLQGQLALPLNSKGETDLGRFRVRYTSELGIEILDDKPGEDVAHAS
ncbi:CRISPR-associated helicase Cas3' [Corynebacterium riegelii]